MITPDKLAAVIARDTHKDRILRKLAAVVVLASVALAGCSAADAVARADTEARVATVRAGIEAQIAYFEGGCGAPTAEQEAAHSAALAITDPGFLRDRLDDAICEDGRFLPMNGIDR